MPIAMSESLRELPGFLSTISMVVDDQSLIIQDLKDAERKSPSVYGPAREMFCRVLDGSLSFEKALSHARTLSDQTEKKCAVEILLASKRFLTSAANSRIGYLPAMEVSIFEGPILKISSVYLRHLEPKRLMILHFWQKPLLSRQLGAAASILKIAMEKYNSEWINYEIDFISVAIPSPGAQRQFKTYDWKQLKPLNDSELRKFWKLLVTAWNKYQKLSPRSYVIRRKKPDLFDSK